MHPPVSYLCMKTFYILAYFYQSFHVSYFYTLPIVFDCFLSLSYLLYSLLLHCHFLLWTHQLSLRSCVPWVRAGQNRGQILMSVKLCLARVKVETASTLMVPSGVSVPWAMFSTDLGVVALVSLALPVCCLAICTPTFPR